ncbi:hypothetical protein [Cellulomonas sp. URHD0024]|nr:hypothetical protein [Cellulomonas sp. URHD0024]
MARPSGAHREVHASVADLREVRISVVGSDHVVVAPGAMSSPAPDGCTV